MSQPRLRLPDSACSPPSGRHTKHLCRSMPYNSLQGECAKYHQAPGSPRGCRQDELSGSANTERRLNAIHTSLLKQQAADLLWLTTARHKHQQNHNEHEKVMQSAKETACSTHAMQQLAQGDMDWSELNRAVSKYQLPHPQTSLVQNSASTATAGYGSTLRRNHMARTLSSKARSAGYVVRRRSSDSQLPVSTMYQGKQQAQICAEVNAECSSNRLSSTNDHARSTVQPYLHAHTGGLAHTYGNRSRDQTRVTADLVNSMREARSEPSRPMTTSWIVAKSNLWPAAAADGGLTVRRQALAQQSQSQSA